MNREPTVLVLGGGIAALGCCLALAEAGIAFSVVTEDLGGRVVYSDAGDVPYGAYYVLSNYRHVTPLCSQRHRIWPWEVVARIGGRDYTFFSPRFAPIWGQMWRHLRELRQFARRLARFRERAALIGQKAAMELDPPLHDLYFSDARQWLADRGMTRWGERYFGPVGQASAFLGPEDLTAFDFLMVSLNLILPCYQFRLDFERLTRPFADAVVRDRVTSLATEPGRSVVRTAKHGVLAAPYVVVACGEGSTRLLGPTRPATGTAAPAYMAHVRGQLQAAWEGRSHRGFPVDDGTLALARQRDGTYLLYARHEKIDIGAYFARYEVIAQRAWHPAFRLGRRPLQESQVADRVFVVGDYNVCCLEDAYVTGLHAAQAIARSLRTLPVADAPVAADAAGSLTKRSA